MSNQIIKRFNNILESLLLQLSKFTGSKYHYKFKRIIKINSLMPIKFWIKHGLEYKTEIMSKNENYFLIQDINSDNFKENCLLEIMKLKDLYNTVDEKSKDNLWIYLQSLIILSEDYINIKKI
jgi:hypothetical protein